jgi:hypothetical protein
MRNDARPIGEEFEDIAKHDPQNSAKDREPAEGARRTNDPDVPVDPVDPVDNQIADEQPPDASER